MNRALLAFDPGAASIAWARFEATRLVDAGFLREIQRSCLVRVCRELLDRVRPVVAVCELPQVYQQRRWKGDPNDLISVAVTVGAVAALCAPFCECQLVKPHDWKGTRPKSVDNDQTFGILEVGEKKIVAGYRKTTTGHNVLDAVGVGLWRLGRK